MNAEERAKSLLNALMYKHNSEQLDFVKEHLKSHGESERAKALRELIEDMVETLSREERLRALKPLVSRTLKTGDPKTLKMIDDTLEQGMEATHE